MSVALLESPPGRTLAGVMTSSQDVYQVRTRKDKRGVDLISDGCYLIAGDRVIANRASACSELK